MIIFLFTIASVFTPKSINTSVIFKADGTPISLEVYIQVQFVCESGTQSPCNEKA